MKNFRIVAAIALVMLALSLLPYLGHMYFRMKSSGAYQAAEGFVRNSSEIKALVGDDMALKIRQSGYVNSSDGEDRAKIGFKVSGSRGSTDVLVYLKKDNGRWNVATATYRDRFGVNRRLSGP